MDVRDVNGDLLAFVELDGTLGDFEAVYRHRNLLLSGCSDMDALILARGCTRSRQRTDHQLGGGLSCYFHPHILDSLHELDPLLLSEKPTGITLLTEDEVESSPPAESEAARE